MLQAHTSSSEVFPLLLVLSFGIRLNTPVSAAVSPPLSKALLATAQAVDAVMRGSSLSDKLATVPAALRPQVQALSFHAMRHWGFARTVRALMVPRAPANSVLDALLLVALTLLDVAVQNEQATAEAPVTWLPATPVYAIHTVVDQAVQAANTKALSSGKALLNACLRRFIREYDDLTQQALTRPVARYNHPEWWIKRLRSAYPKQWQALLQAANQPGPLVLRVNERRSSVDQLLAACHEHGVNALALGGQAIWIDPPRPVHDIPGFEQGWWSVQDMAAQQAGRLLPVANGMRVLDACAAPGGKTAHLLEQYDIHLTALDSDPVRIERINDTLGRLGLKHDHQVELRCADAVQRDTWWDGQPFDAILADVPCTASGVVRRHPDIRWLRRETDIAATAALQRTILDTLWSTLKPGGHLLYATCSLFPEECEQQAHAFVQRQPDACRLSAPGQLLPLVHEGESVAPDGFFYALFVKAK